MCNITPCDQLQTAAPFTRIVCTYKEPTYLEMLQPQILPTQEPRGQDCRSSLEAISFSTPAFTRTLFRDECFRTSSTSITSKPPRVPRYCFPHPAKAGSGFSIRTRGREERSFASESYCGFWNVDQLLLIITHAHRADKTKQGLLRTSAKSKAERRE